MIGSDVPDANGGHQFVPLLNELIPFALPLRWQAVLVEPSGAIVLSTPSMTVMGSY